MESARILKGGKRRMAAGVRVGDLDVRDVAFWENLGQRSRHSAR